MWFLLLFSGLSFAGSSHNEAPPNPSSPDAPEFIELPFNLSAADTFCVSKDEIYQHHIEVFEVGHISENRLVKYYPSSGLFETVDGEATQKGTHLYYSPRGDKKIKNSVEDSNARFEVLDLRNKLLHAGKGSADFIDEGNFVQVCDGTKCFLLDGQTLEELEIPGNEIKEINWVRQKRFILAKRPDSSRFVQDLKTKNILWDQNNFDSVEFRPEVSRDGKVLFTSEKKKESDDIVARSLEDVPKELWRLPFDELGYLLGTSSNSDFLFFLSLDRAHINYVETLTGARYQRPIPQGEGGIKDVRVCLDGSLFVEYPNKSAIWDATRPFYESQVGNPSNLWEQLGSLDLPSARRAYLRLKQDSHLIDLRSKLKNSTAHADIKIPDEAIKKLASNVNDLGANTFTVRKAALRKLNEIFVVPSENLTPEKLETLRAILSIVKEASAKLERDKQREQSLQDLESGVIELLANYDESNRLRRLRAESLLHP